MINNDFLVIISPEQLDAGLKNEFLRQINGGIKRRVGRVLLACEVINSIKEELIRHKEKLAEVK